MQNSLLAIDIFDKSITDEVEKLKKELGDLKFDPTKAILFKITETTKDRFDDLPKEKGLYLFEINIEALNKIKNTEEAVDELINLWNDKLFRPSFSPAIIGKRIVEIKKEKQRDWVPLYIGKSKKLSSRISEHIFSPTSDKTYAMKLNKREQFKDFEFRVCTIPLDIKNYDFIVPYLESHLREIHHPIIGKQ